MSDRPHETDERSAGSDRPAARPPTPLAAAPSETRGDDGTSETVTETRNSEPSESASASSSPARDEALPPAPSDGAGTGETVAAPAAEPDGGDEARLPQDFDFERHGAAGGHTVERGHIGASDEAIIERNVEGGELPNGVSSFYDRPTAARAVTENLAANDDAVQDWMTSGRSPKEAFDHTHDFSTGRHAPGGATDVGEVGDVTGSRIVLRRDPSMVPEGYRLQTSFPRPGEEKDEGR